MQGAKDSSHFFTAFIGTLAGLEVEQLVRATGGDLTHYSIAQTPCPGALSVEIESWERTCKRALVLLAEDK